MGQSKPFRQIALVVEDDELLRDLIATLLEESDYDVIECESAEAAELVLNKNGSCISLMLTDVQLAGHMSGLELAQRAMERVPNLPVLITSGQSLPGELPAGTSFLPKPWTPLDLLRYTESIVSERGPAH